MDACNLMLSRGQRRPRFLGPQHQHRARPAVGTAAGDARRRSVPDVTVRNFVAAKKNRPHNQFCTYVLTMNFVANADLRFPGVSILLGTR